MNVVIKTIRKLIDKLLISENQVDGSAGNRVSTDSKPAIEYREDLTRRGHTCQLSLCRASIAHILPSNKTRRI